MALTQRELGTLDRYCAVTDTLALARERHPGKKNGLDALCKQYGVDNSRRELHGALLDAQLLAEVYLAMSGGQAILTFVEAGDRAVGGPRRPRASSGTRGPLPVWRASEAETQAHEARVIAIDRASGGRCLWRELGW
jgi:DNA polymerase-3 subunit epsilon